MKQNQNESNFQKLYKKLSDSQKSLFALYRQMSVCLSIPGNQKVCDCIAAYYAEAQSLAEHNRPADSELPSERSEQESSADGKSVVAAGG